MKGLIITFFLFILSSECHAQSFSIASGNAGNFSTGTYSGKGIAFGDYDNDGDLDLLVLGIDTIPSKIYLNNGQGYFTPLVVTSLPIATSSSYQYPYIDAQWFDYNNDGLLDLVLHLVNSYVRVYQNNGNPNNPFGLIYSLNYTNILNAGWADLNQNGSQDIYCHSYTTNNKILKNNHTSSTNPFVPETSSIGGLPYYHNSNFDYSCVFDPNKDGFSDLYFKFKGPNGAALYTGQKTSPRLNLRYSATSPQYADVIPFDLNANGNYNILRNNGGQSGSRIMEFQGDTLIEILSISNLDFHDYPYQYIQFFDYNNDGKVDIFSDNHFYTNNGNLSFSKSSNGFTIENKPIVADIDNDHDLDFFARYHDMTYLHKSDIFKNTTTNTNTPPTAPQVMWTEMDSSRIIFRWQAATDMETPQQSLSYNLMVGTSSKAIDITSPLSDTATGFRRVVSLGNAFMNTFYVLDKNYFQIGDTLYWSVQTIDNGFGYSPFSKENFAVIVQRMDAPDFDTLCSNDSLFWHGAYYLNQGRYFKSYGNGDSVFVLDLNVKPAYLNEQLVDLCAGQSYNWNGQNHFNTGTYTVYNTTTAGCDSIERLVLAMHPTHTHIQNASICRGDSLAFSGKYLKESGTYVDSLQSSFSCDSLVQLTLEVFPKDTVVLFSGDSLVAHSNTAGIRWWDCQNQTYVFNAYGKVFVPQQNGHYAAELTENGCSWLSQCFEITGMGIPSPKIPTLHIQPNPTSSIVNIAFPQSQMNILIEIFSLDGKKILEKHFSDLSFINLNISHLPNGVYLMKATTDRNVFIEKIIKN